MLGHAALPWPLLAVFRPLWLFSRCTLVSRLCVRCHKGVRLSKPMHSRLSHREGKLAACGKRAYSSTRRACIACEPDHLWELHTWTPIATTAVKQIRSPRTCDCGCAIGWSTGRLYGLLKCSSAGYVTLHQRVYARMSDWCWFRVVWLCKRDPYRGRGGICCPQSKFISQTAPHTAT